LLADAKSSNALSEASSADTQPAVTDACDNRN
jgi:hypothetical protein